MDCPALQIIIANRKIPCRFNDCKGYITIFRSTPHCPCCYDVRSDLLPKKENQ